jgi:hypothetical protein
MRNLQFTFIIFSSTGECSQFLVFEASYIPYGNRIAKSVARRPI